MVQTTLPSRSGSWWKLERERTRFVVRLLFSVLVEFCALRFCLFVFFFFPALLAFRFSYVTVSLFFFPSSFLLVSLHLFFSVFAFFSWHFFCPPFVSCFFFFHFRRFFNFNLLLVYSFTIFFSCACSTFFFFNPCSCTAPSHSAKLVSSRGGNQLFVFLVVMSAIFWNRSPILRSKVLRCGEPTCRNHFHPWCMSHHSGKVNCRVIGSHAARNCRWGGFCSFYFTVASECEAILSQANVTSCEKSMFWLKTWRYLRQDLAQKVHPYRSTTAIVKNASNNSKGHDCNDGDDDDDDDDTGDAYIVIVV